MSILFLTGAGVSANAGIPTYRDAGSSWVDEDLEKKSHSNRYGNHLDELWDKHWGPVGKVMDLAEPTYTHKAIAAFQKSHEAIVATQNIDSLHERAGSDNVAHVHGDIIIKCMKCKKEADTYGWAGAGAPACMRCGKRKTRPNVVLFGEMLNSKLMGGLERFAQQQATHIISVGTSLNVYPVAGLVLDTISKKDVTIINIQPTPFDKWATHVYNADCDSVIDEVLSRVDSELKV